MSSDYDSELVKRAIIHFKAGELELAGRYLERALDAADDQETRALASYWLSQIVTDRVRKRSLLEDVLAYDRNHPEARRALAILDGKLKPEELVDANNLPPQAAGGEKAVTADRFTCPKCGARMVYTPDGRALTCEYCTRSQRLDTDPARPAERDFFTAMATEIGHRQPVTMHAFACRGCGAEFVLAPQVLSSTCAYCASPHVIDLESSRELIEPDAIIPMAIDQRGAAGALVRWAREHELTPQGKVQAPRGLYMPAWSFDVGGQLRYSGEIVERTQRRAIVVTPVSGDLPVYLYDVLVPAEKKAARLLLEAMPGYDLKDAVPYDSRFLADWPAEVYQISMSDASLEARSIAYARFKRQVPAMLGAHVENLRTSSAGLSVEKFKLLLLPAWLTSMRLEDQDQPVFINGQTGAVVGPRLHPSGGLSDWFADLIGR